MPMNAFIQKQPAHWESLARKCLEFLSGKDTFNERHPPHQSN